ncbi:16S rRNA (guanine(527)-N(7))-methyltransferase RsmG [bacterium]|nr:16S rRNA (guanine(527)-N(7))-methyltransferase RsmG [bacterium]RQV93312.1 MAG: 16S rRNA (guanine(527)-N(7))-methyltransferase RsmG [bacterium]
MEQIELLRKTMIQSNIAVSEEMVGQFSRYRQLLILWNQKINLISRNDESRIVSKHFLESLGLVKVVLFPQGTTVLDLGTGAGFPGVPLKIIRPDIHMVLVESKKKKILFLKKLVEELGLTGVEVIPGRIEEIGNTIKPVHFVVTRSVANLIQLVKWSKDCMRPQGGVLIAIKGPAVEEELNRLDDHSADLGVTGWCLEKYDPFSSTMRLKEMFVASIQMCKSKKPTFKP